jgi:hypothetical protein
MPLTKGEACTNLVTAIKANRKYKGSKTGPALDAAYGSCMNNWRKPKAKRVNPKTSGCPKKTVTIKPKRGPAVSFTAHKCGKMSSKPSRRTITAKVPKSRRGKK